MEPLFTLSDILTRLAISLVLGSVIGWERETHDRPAGLRTHALVCIGSTIYMILSLTFVENADPSRIASQVATGMGFLGAGTIIRSGSSVRGLTTAASLWAVAAIGLCVGRGGAGYMIAVSSTAFVFVTLRGLSWVERRMVMKRQYRLLLLRARNTRELIPNIQAQLEEQGVRLQSWDIGEPAPNGVEEIRLSLRIPPNLALSRISNALSALDSVLGVEWD